MRIRVPGLDDVCRLVAQGAGIAIVPESAARRSARTLRSLRLTDDWATRQLNLCARSFDVLTPQAKLLAAGLVGTVQHGLTTAIRPTRAARPWPRCIRRISWNIR